ncbi:MAG: uridine kinase [Motilibacteraceae bacterium]
MRVRPLTPQALAAEVVERVAALPGRVRVAVDGAPAARPEVLADALVEPLRVLGRPVARVPAAGFWRPASVRLEHGREDPDAFYEDWLDAGALAREVLDPLEDPGPAHYLPSLWDPVTDRATREPYAEAPEGLVVVVDGALLLGRWLAFDLTVHLALSPAALARRTPPEQAWTLPAYERYAEEVLPEQVADVVVRADDPRRPALVEP